MKANKEIDHGFHDEYEKEGDDLFSLSGSIDTIITAHHDRIIKLQFLDLVDQ